jgi:hypothetical protein
VLRQKRNHDRYRSTGSYVPKKRYSLVAGLDAYGLPELVVINMKIVDLEPP